MREMFITVVRFSILLSLELYQRLLSPDHSFWSKAFFPYGYCRYSPSCSEYARQAIKKQGVLLGVPKSGWRVLRCNPWSRGGVDNP